MSMRQLEVENATGSRSPAGRPRYSSSWSASRGDAKRSSKSWLATSFVPADEVRLAQRIPSGGAQIDPTEAQKIIGCVTKFATCMCVCIVVLKVGVYFNGKQAVVKTSALDSLGDLVANMLSMYTGYRMNKIDIDSYPVGQATFEPVGVAVFTTLMASAMFANLLNNIEDIMSAEAAEREDDIWELWNLLFAPMQKLAMANGVTSSDFTNKALQDIYAVTGEDKVHEAVSGTVDMIASTDDAAEDFWGLFGVRMWNETRLVLLNKGVKFDDVKDEPLKTVLKAGDAEEAQQATKPYIQGVTTYFAVKFLACCAGYKLCLWLFCITYAIPRTRSSVLTALATDKRNDFFATSSVIACLLVGYHRDLGDWLNDKLDPLCSAILTCVIIYTWVALLLEQVVVLIRSTAPGDLLEALKAEAQATVSGGPVTVGAVRAFSIGQKYGVEVELVITSSQVPFDAVDKMVSRVKQRIDMMDEVERTIVISKGAGVAPAPA